MLSVFPILRFQKFGSVLTTIYKREHTLYTEVVFIQFLYSIVYVNVSQIFLDKATNFHVSFYQLKWMDIKQKILTNEWTLILSLGLSPNKFISMNDSFSRSNLLAGQSDDMNWYKWWTSSSDLCTYVENCPVCEGYRFLFNKPTSLLSRLLFLILSCWMKCLHMYKMEGYMQRANGWLLLGLCMHFAMHVKVSNPKKSFGPPSLVTIF